MNIDKRVKWAIERLVNYVADKEYNDYGEWLNGDGKGHAGDGSHIAEDIMLLERLFCGKEEECGQEEWGNK